MGTSTSEVNATSTQYSKTEKDTLDKNTTESRVSTDNFRDQMTAVTEEGNADKLFAARLQGSVDRTNAIVKVTNAASAGIKAAVKAA